MKTSEIISFLDATFHPEYQEDYDNAGFLFGNPQQEICGMMVALDLTPEVIDEAIAKQCNLIITHHPFIFGGIKRITTNNTVGRMIFKMAQHNLCVYAAHTNLDNAPGGVNDRLSEVLGLQNISVIDPHGTDEQGREWGLLRAGETAPQSLTDFAAFVKEKLHCKGLRYIDGGKMVHKVAVGGGACGDEAEAALRAGCDTLVTADVKYNQFQDAMDRGLNLIDAGHFETENPICEVLAAYLQEKFPAIQVVLSQKHHDSVQFL